MSKIITAEDLAQYLGIETNDRLIAVAKSANDFVENYTHRVFGETKSIEETHDLCGVIFLRRGKVQQVNKLTVAGYAMPLQDLRINNDTGRVAFASPKMLTSFSAYDQIDVEYTCGETSVPADLKLAVLQMAVDSYNRRDAEGANVSSESVGDYSIAFGTTTGSDQYAKNSANRVLDAYAMRNV